MADDCCSPAEALRERQSSTLKIVLAINAVMFCVLVVAALYARSSALLSDSLDNFGDTLAYAFSLYAVGLGARMKARVALFKGLLILLAALAVTGQITYKLIYPSVPIYQAMGGFSLLGLVANSACFLLLWRHRAEDVNMSSVWECSRNDIASNVSVFVAAIGVWATGAGWPDIFVASCLALFLLRSAARIVSSARVELRASALAG